MTAPRGIAASQWRCSGGLRFRAISAGHHHTLAAVTAADQGYCWGLNQAGSLGDGTRQRRLVPTAIEGDLSFSSVSAGGVELRLPQLRSDYERDGPVLGRQRVRPVGRRDDEHPGTAEAGG